MTQRFPLKDRVDLQTERLLNVAPGTELTDAVNLEQLQMATGTTVPDYETQSNIPVLTTELTAETYVFRVQNNTETALGQATGLSINGNPIPAENRDISRGVGAGRFAYFSFTIPTAVLSNLQRNPNNVEVDITFPVVGNIRVADEVSSHVGVTYDLSVESSSVANSADIRLSGGDGSQDNVTLQGINGTTVGRSGNTITFTSPIDAIVEWTPNTLFVQGQIILRTAESTVDGVVVASAGGLFYSVREHTSPATFSDDADLVPIPLTEVEWTAKLFDPRGFYETGDLVTTETGEDTGVYQVWIHSGVGLDGRVATNGIPPENRPDGTNSSSFWQLLMQGGGGTSVWPVYADTGDASTNTQSFASSGGEFIAFYRSSSEPTLPIRTGISFVDYVGDNGAMGDQGPQGRFFIRIFRRFAGAPTNPTLGSYDADTGVLTPPTDWFLTPPSGSDTLYVSDTTIDPSTMTTGAFVPSWSPAVQAGGTGPAGPDGTVPLVTSLTGVANAIQGVILTAVDGSNQPGYYYRTSSGGTWLPADTDTNTGVMTVGADSGTDLDFTGSSTQLNIFGQGNIASAIASNSVNLNFELPLWLSTAQFNEGQLTRGSNNGIYQATCLLYTSPSPRDS